MHVLLLLKSFVLSQNSRGLVGNDHIELEAALQQVTQRLVAIQEGLQVGTNGYHGLVDLDVCRVEAKLFLHHVKEVDGVDLRSLHFLPLYLMSIQTLTLTLSRYSSTFTNFTGYFIVKLTVTVRRILAYSTCNLAPLFLLIFPSVDNTLIFLIEFPIFLGVSVLGEKISSRMLNRFSRIQDCRLRESKGQPILQVTNLGWPFGFYVTITASHLSHFTGGSGCLFTWWAAGFTGLCVAFCYTIFDWKVL